MKLNFTHFIAILCMVFFANSLQAQVPAAYTWQEVNSVDFGDGANHFMIKAATAGLGGEVELRLDAADGPAIGHAFFHQTGSPDYFLDYECDLYQSVSGTHDVYMNFLDYAEPITEEVLETGAFEFTLIEDSPVPPEGNLHVYPPVPGLDASPYYELRVQKVSALNSANLADVTNWETPFAWFTRCEEDDKGYYSGYIGGWSLSYANFELDPNTPVVVKITRKDDTGDAAPSGPITMAAVHPAHQVDSWEIIDGDVYVTMSKPAFVAVDIDGQMDTRKAPRAYPTGWNFPYNSVALGSHSVSIFANPFISDKPDPEDPGVLVVKAGELIPDNLDELEWNTLYFEPGVHLTSVDLNEQGELVERRWEAKDVISLEDNKAYYIPGDAIVYGNFTGKNGSNPSNNIRVYGHGVISGKKILHHKSWTDYPGGEYDDPWAQRSIVLKDARNCRIEGISFDDPAFHTMGISSTKTMETEPTGIIWTKVIGWRANSDAISLGGNVYVKDCFFRTQDDGLYIGGAKPIRRCVFWHDVNGQTFRGDFMTDRIQEDYHPSMPQQLVAEDIDIIYARAVFTTDDNGSGIIGVEGGWSNQTLPGGTENTGQMLVFRNIRISDPMPTRNLLFFDVKDKTNDYAGIRFENVEFKGPQVFGWRDHLEGSSDAVLRNFVFDNVSINGEKMDANYLNDPTLCKKDHVYDFTFRLHDTIPSTDYVLIRTATNGTIKLDTTAGSNELTVTAIPNPGYTFSGWSGALSGTDTVATFTMDGHKALTANYSLISYFINASSENGKIVLDPDQPWYLPGTEVSIRAVGDLGYAFEEWGGDLSGIENPIVVSMDNDLDFSASYVSVPTYTVTSSADHGAIILDPLGGEYSEGVELTVLYKKEFGYKLDEWSGDLSGSENPQTIIMDADKDITALTEFTGDAITSYAINCGGGAYEAADGTQFTKDMNFSGGNTYSTASSISGTDDPTLYQTERYGDLVYSFDLNNGDYILTLMFAEIYADNPGARLFNVLIDDELYIDSLDLYSEVGKNAAYNESFSVYVKDGSIDVELQTIRDNAKISAVKIMPVFEGAAYTLATETANGAIVTEPAGKVFMENTRVAVEAVPDENFLFTEWGGDLSGTDNPSTVTMISDMSITAAFLDVTGRDDPGRVVSDKSILLQNYPNPFFSWTIIPYELSEASHVRLTVFNFLGEAQTVLVDEYQSAGTYTVEWKGTDNQDNPLASGLYIYQMEVDNQSLLFRKAVIIK